MFATKEIEFPLTSIRNKYITSKYEYLINEKSVVQRLRKIILMLPLNLKTVSQNNFQITQFQIKLIYVVH